MIVLGTHTHMDALVLTSIQGVSLYIRHQEVSIGAADVPTPSFIWFITRPQGPGTCFTEPFFNDKGQKSVTNLLTTNQKQGFQ